MEHSFYEVLGVDKQSTPAEIKARWKKLAWDLHPDRHGNTETVNAAFAVLSRAYANLSDPALRNRYDTQNSVGSMPCEKCRTLGRLWSRVGFASGKSRPCDACGGTGYLKKQGGKYARKR